MSKPRDNKGPHLLCDLCFLAGEVSGQFRQSETVEKFFILYSLAAGATSYQSTETDITPAVIL